MQWKKKPEKGNFILFSQLLRLKLYMLKKYKTLFQVLSGRIQWLTRIETLTFLPLLRFPTYYTILVKKNEFVSSYRAVHFLLISKVLKMIKKKYGEKVLGRILSSILILNWYRRWNDGCSLSESLLLGWFVSRADGEITGAATRYVFDIWT